MRLQQQSYHTDWLAKAARNILPSTVAVSETNPRVTYTGLHPKERAAMANMIATRSREYSAGRMAASDALAQLHVFGQPVIQGQDRAPIWPAGIVGSIAHTSTHCLAVAAQACDIESIGIDIEPNCDLNLDLTHEICTFKELEWLDQQPLLQRGKLARLIFSAKECAYKCQYPLTHEIFGFDTLHIQIDQATSSFIATFDRSVTMFNEGHQLSGRFYTDHDTILTTLYVRDLNASGNTEL